ncbi:MAG TPA: hypothetical protein VIJ57_15905 [Hanamia sp.]
MKKIFWLLTILFGLTFLIQSCKKDTTTEPIDQTITKTLIANQSYEFDLGNFGYEEGASISKQATNFSISTLDREINTGKVIYKYVPATNFIGTDEVEIKSARGSDGASPNNRIIFTTIKFTITN